MQCVVTRRNPSRRGFEYGRHRALALFDARIGSIGMDLVLLQFRPFQARRADDRPTLLIHLASQQEALLDG